MISLTHSSEKPSIFRPCKYVVPINSETGVQIRCPYGTQLLCDWYVARYGTSIIQLIIQAFIELFMCILGYIYFRKALVRNHGLVHYWSSFHIGYIPNISLVTQQGCHWMVLQPSEKIKECSSRQNIGEINIPKNL